MFQGEPIWKNDRIDPHESVCTTTAGESYTYGETCLMAHLIHKRFGRNAQAAAFAWRRLMQNDATEADFMRLVEDHQTMFRQQAIASAMNAMDPRGH